MKQSKRWMKWMDKKVDSGKKKKSEINRGRIDARNKVRSKQ